MGDSRPFTIPLDAVFGSRLSLGITGMLSQNPLQRQAMPSRPA